MGFKETWDCHACSDSHIFLSTRSTAAFRMSKQNTRVVSPRPPTRLSDFLAIGFSQASQLECQGEHSEHWSPWCLPIPTEPFRGGSVGVERSPALKASSHSENELAHALPRQLTSIQIRVPYRNEPLTLGVFISKYQK